MRWPHVCGYKHHAHKARRTRPRSPAEATRARGAQRFGFTCHCARHDKSCRAQRQACCASTECRLKHNNTTHGRARPAPNTRVCSHNHRPRRVRRARGRTQVRCRRGHSPLTPGRTRRPWRYRTGCSCCATSGCSPTCPSQRPTSSSPTSSPCRRPLLMEHRQRHVPRAMHRQQQCQCSATRGPAHTMPARDTHTRTRTQQPQAPSHSPP